MATQKIPPLAIEFDIDDKGTLVVKKIEGTLKDLGTSMDKSGKNMDKMGTRSKKLTAFLSKMKVGILAGASAAAALGVAILAVTKKAANFESAVVALGRVTRTPFEKMRKDLLALNSELGSPEELAKGYYAAISAGAAEGTEALELLTSASKTAQITGLTVDEVIAATTKTYRSFGDEVAGVTTVLDKFFAAEEQGQLTVAELGTFIGDLGSVAKNTGITIDEMLGSVAQISQFAGTASIAGTQLKALMSQLAGETTEMTNIVESLGYATAIGVVQNNGFIKGLQMIRDKAVELNIPLKKVIGSVEALGAMFALTNENMEDAASKIVVVSNATGRLENAWEDFKKTFNATISTLFNSISRLIVLVGLDFQDAFVSATNGLNQLINSTSNYVQKNKEFISLGIDAVFGLIAESIRFTFMSLEVGIQILDIFTPKSIQAKNATEDWGDGIVYLLNAMVALKDTISNVTNFMSIHLELATLSVKAYLATISDVVNAVNNAKSIIGHVVPAARAFPKLPVVDFTKEDAMRMASLGARVAAGNIPYEPVGASIIDPNKFRGTAETRRQASLPPGSFGKGGGISESGESGESEQIKVLKDELKSVEIGERKVATAANDVAVATSFANEEIKEITNSYQDMRWEIVSTLLESNKFVDGIQAGMMLVEDRIGTVAQRVADVWVTTFDKMRDTLTDFIVDGTADWKDFVNAIRRSMVQNFVVDPLLGAINQGAKSFFAGSVFGLANGGILEPPAFNFMAEGGINYSKKQSGITDGPTIIAGERFRKEAYIPLPSGETIPVRIMEDSGRQRGQIVQNTFNITTKDAESFLESDNQNKIKSNLRVQRAYQRR